MEQLINYLVLHVTQKLKEVLSQYILDLILEAQKVNDRDKISIVISTKLLRETLIKLV